MKRRLAGVLMGWVLAAGAATCGGHGDRTTMLVSTEWLAQHLTDKNLVIVAVGPPADYQAGHIPGAVALTMNDVSTPMEMGKLMLELPPVAQLQKTFAGLGITNDSRIVLYLGNTSVQSMTRVYLTLDAMGLGARASILNGGMKTWKAENRAVSTEVPAVKQGKLDLCPQADVIATLDFVKSNVRQAGVRILDARAEQFYSGASAGKTHDGQDQRRGHIPGAGNLPFSSLFDEQGKIHPEEQLKKQFAEAGVKSGDRVVSYCHIGQQATVVYFAARYLGYDARMYDGSWDEWNAHTELPVEMSK